MVKRYTWRRPLQSICAQFFGFAGLPLELGILYPHLLIYPPVGCSYWIMISAMGKFHWERRDFGGGVEEEEEEKVAGNRAREPIRFSLRGEERNLYHSALLARGELVDSGAET